MLSFSQTDCFTKDKELILTSYLLIAGERKYKSGRKDCEEIMIMVMQRIHEKKNEISDYFIP